MIRVFFTILIFLTIVGCSGGITEVTIISDYDSHITSGWDEYNNKNYDVAQQSFEKAKVSDSSKPEAYIGSGWALLRLQKPYDAVVSFRDAFDYVTSVNDSVEALCGLSGAYLAAGEITDVVTIFKRYTISSYDGAFPFRKHDYSINRDDLEIVQAMAFYRLKIYSSTEQPDPDNAVYHFNQALYTPYEYTDPQDLMEEITDYLNESGNKFF